MSERSGLGESQHVSTGELPSPEVVAALVTDACERHRSVTSGARSKVYPALSRVPAELFGVCVAGAGGARSPSAPGISP